MQQQPSHEMSFLEHLEVLRWHIIRSVIAIVICGTWAFFNKELIFDGIIFAPKKADFITYTLLCKLSYILHTWFPSLIENDTLCIGQDFPKLQDLEMTGSFMIHLMISVVSGLIISFPYVIWELWRFIKPALSDSEKKYSFGFIFFTSLLFITGVLFSYYLIAPLSINFFLTYSISDEVIKIPQLSSYISILVTLTLACGLTFELPLLMYLLGKLGVISSNFLKKYRKHAFIICLILAAIITPPDVFSQILVTAPLMVLYEISIFIVRAIELKEKKHA